MTRAFGGRALWWAILAIVIAACGSGDEGESVGQSQNAVNSGQALVIRQIYPGNGTYSRAFVEIYNRGTGPVSLGGMSLQGSYESGSYSPWSLITTLPSMLLQPKQSFLVASREYTPGPDLPSYPDVVAPSSLAWNSTGLTNPGSRVALVKQGDRAAWDILLTCATPHPCTIDPADVPRLVDLVGFGTGKPPGGWPNSSLPAEGTSAPYPSSTQSLLRKANGTQDTDSNVNDFVLGAPEPRNMDSYVAPLPIPGAPVLDATTGTTPGALSGFIYDSTNPNAPQTGVTAGAIDPARAGWVVGYVKDGSGAAIAGATVSIVGQGQYGQATTRADGRFDMVVNGSANFTLRFAKTGFLSADRRVYVGAQLTASVDDVWLVTADSNAKVVTASSSNFQVATGSLVAADADSTSRTAVLMIPPQTKFRKGTTDLSSITLRLTEYTAGPNGINRMPASLTGSPAYTYAVEISADEAAGQSVDFVKNVAGNPEQQAFFYVNDLVGFPVGSAVPTGYYDRNNGAWIRSTSGTAIQVVVTGGVATVDINGGGVDSPAVVDAFGIKPEELATLATQYGKAGQTTTTKLWRVPITHMTPYDCNWPVVPPPCEGAVCPGPQGTPPPPPSPTCSGNCCGGGGKGDANSDNLRTGSIIGCDSGMLGETVNVAGTPYSLNYSSYRTPGYAAKRQVKIALTDDGPVHTAERLIAVDVAIAGQVHHREFVPAKNLSWTFQWDGMDAAGRPLVGSAIAYIKIKSYYWNKYVPVALFGELPNPTTPGVASQRAFVSYERTFQAPLMGQVPTGGWSLGDWTLSHQHFYDVLGNTVHLGSGGRIPSALQTSVISRIMGDGQASGFAPDGTSATATGTGFNLGGNDVGDGAVATGPNGDVFMIDRSSNRVRRIDSAGKIWTVAGSGTPACPQGVITAPTFANNTTDATLANVTEPTALAVGSDGSLYIGTAWERTIRKATPNGLTPDGRTKYSISNFAGGNAQCNATVASTTENELATSATFKSVTALAVGPDGSVYIADADAYRVRRVDLAGKISTIAGNGNSGGPARTDEGKLATGVSVSNVSDIAVGPDGTLYIAQPYNLLSVDKNGTLHFLNQAFDRETTLADGVPLSTQSIDINFQSVAVTPTGTVLFNDDEWQRHYPSGSNPRAWIRTLAPSGIVTSLASTPDVTNSTGQTPAANGLALGNAPPRARGIAAAPNGDVIVMDNYSVYRISPARLPDTTGCADSNVRYLVPSGDSGFCFDGNGRHKKTIDLHTGKALYTFGYDANTGFLTSITDPGGRVTNVVKTATTFEISAPAPGNVNQKTTVTVANGHASKIADGIGSFRLQPAAAANGLLSQLVDGENNAFTFTYDTDGYLWTDTSPLGKQTLTRSIVAGGKTATLTSPLGLKTIFDTTLDSQNVLKHKTTFPDLTTEVKTKTPAGVEQTVGRDGTTTTAKVAVVSQLKGQIPLTASQTVTLPSGLTMTTLRTLSDPDSGPRVAKVMYDDTASPPTETTTTTYSATSKTIVTTSPVNRSTTVKTDGTGHVTQRQIGTLTPTDFTYINGQLATATQGARATIYSYVTNSADVDAGYLYQVQDPINTTETRRDLRGRPLSIESALGTAVAAKNSFTWFNHDLLRTVRTPERFKTPHTFAYNAVKEIQQYLPPALSGVTDPATNYTYTNDRDLLTEQPSGLASMTRAYIPGTGQLDTITLPGTTLSTLAGTIDYDYFTTTDAATGAAAGRISRITGPTAGNSLVFKYDGSLRTSQTWAGDVTGQVTWLYNNRFWPKQETLASGSTFNRFFGYDKDGLLLCNSPTTCNPAGADALKITHSAIHGGVTLIDQGGASGALETWSYSDTAADQSATPKPMAFGELREQLATVGGTAAANLVADLVYDAAGGAASERRDKLGRIRFKTETFRDATPDALGVHASVTKKFEYIYDERGQLKSAYLGGALSGTLIYDATYDKNSNRTTFKTASAGPVTSCVVDAQDRLQNCGAIVFTYYDNGEVKTKVNSSGTWTYHYDALGRLRQVAKTGGNTYDYVVDGEGRRIAKKVNGTIQQRWLYGDGLSPIAELDSAGSVVARYIYGSRKNTPDLVIKRQLVNGAWFETPYRLISDSLGTPRYAVNVANKDDVKYQVSYSPLGVPTVGGGLAASTISWTPFGFAGGLYDSDTGLVHFGAREYDPEIGRWTSKDPIRFAGGQTNIYVYVNNDPVNQLDSEGEGVVDCGKAIADYLRYRDKLNNRIDENSCNPDAGHDKAIDQLRNRVDREKEKVLRHCTDTETLLELGLLGLIGGTLAIASGGGGLILMPAAL